MCFNVLCDQLKVRDRKQLKSSTFMSLILHTEPLTHQLMTSAPATNTWQGSEGEVSKWQAQRRPVWGVLTCSKVAFLWRAASRSSTCCLLRMLSCSLRLPISSSSSALFPKLISHTARIHIQIIAAPVGTTALVKLAGGFVVCTVCLMSVSKRKQTQKYNVFHQIKQNLVTVHVCGLYTSLNNNCSLSEDKEEEDMFY